MMNNLGQRCGYLGRIGLLAWLVLTTRGSVGFASDQPNVVIVLADDMGYGDPTCYNAASKIPTPHIDRIAREGMRFTNAHSPAAWCTPSRYGLLTGHYPWRSPRKIENGVIAPGRATLATQLSRQGYATACIGKWHLGFDESAVQRDFSQPFTGGPCDHGFDYFFGMHASLDIPPYYWIENEACVSPPTEEIGDSHTEGVTPIQGAFWREGKIAPGFKHAESLPTIADKAVGFIRQQNASDDDRPFFLYVPLTAPHTPWLPTSDFEGASRAGMYGDFTTQVDAVVGRVLEALDETQETDNTVLIFSSDNGPCWYPQDTARYGHQSAGPLRGMKIDLWEGGHRIPFIVRWPGKTPAGEVRDTLICFTDLLATVSELVGADVPEGAGEDSFSFLSALRDQDADQPIRENLVIEGRVILQGPWKLVRGNPNGGLSRFAQPPPSRPAGDPLLFHLQRDLGETTDVSQEYPDVVRELEAALDAVRSES